MRQRAGNERTPALPPAGFLLRPRLSSRPQWPAPPAQVGELPPDPGTRPSGDAIDSFHPTPEVIEEFGIAAECLRPVMTTPRESHSIADDPAQRGCQ